MSEKIISRSGGVSINKIRLGRHTDEDIDRFHDGVARIADKPFKINDKTRGRFEVFERELRRLKEIDAVDLVVFDYIQLFNPTKVNQNQNRNLQIANITMSLKQLAMELNVAIIALSQLNRGSDKDNREPRTSDLRDSGSIEQDADVILFITSDKDENRVLTIAKNRSGRQNVKADLKTDLSVNYLGDF
jgi:replicative DNA helicase